MPLHFMSILDTANNMYMDTVLFTQSWKYSFANVSPPDHELFHIVALCLNENQLPSRYTINIFYWVNKY